MKDTSRFIVGTAVLHRKGSAFRTYLPKAISEYLIGMKAHNMMLVADTTRGLIVMTPLSEKKLDKLYADGEALAQVGNG